MPFNPFEKKQEIPLAYFRLFQQESENLVNKIIDHATVLILYIYTDGTIALCNGMVEEMIGRKRQSIVGNNWLSVIFPDESLTMKKQMFKAVMEDCIKYNRPNHYNGAIKDVSGQERFISWSLTPILSESKSVHGVLCIGNDMTVLQEKEASVKKIDHTLRDILSSIKEYALYSVNLDGNITYYGMGSEMIFGWKKEEIIFKHMSLFHLQDDLKSKLIDILVAVDKSGQHETEIEMVHKDGHTFPVILTVSRFLGTDGAAIGYIFIAKDITDRKKMEFQIFQAEKMAAVGQLSAGMAHEVNNPLFVISGRVEMLLDDPNLDAGLRKELEIIKSQSDRIRGLVDRLLKFSRYHKTKTTELLDLNSVIESVVPFLDYQKWSERKVILEKDLAKDLLPIEGNLNELQEVFINLLLNACQAMPQGGKVRVKTRNAEPGFVEARISDTGPGISDEGIKNMFMPFFTTKKEGTGLGLSISYTIIKNHKGSINIETRLNMGTSFIIKLPIAKERKDAVV